MQTINELLNRINWDLEFGEGELELALLDRVEQGMVCLPIREISFVRGELFFFYYFDDENVEHSVLFHRFNALYQNGECICHREH